MKISLKLRAKAQIFVLNIHMLKLLAIEQEQYNFTWFKVSSNDLNTIIKIK
jgi:hypothetical protein